MKVKSIYICEQCGREFELSKDALSCEASHIGLTPDQYDEYLKLIDYVDSYKKYLHRLKTKRAQLLYNESVTNLISFKKRYNLMNTTERKYRYFMCGMFMPTDGEEYEINIPSPFLHESEEDALKDGNFGYRFAWINDANGPEILIYENEKFEIIEEVDKKEFKTWVEGTVLKRYTFAEFTAAGGCIRMLKPECKGSGFIDSNTDFIPTDKCFRDIFPNMEKQRLYYIDNEAYYIEEQKEEHKEVADETIDNK